MAASAIISVTIISMAAISKRGFIDFHAHCLPGIDDGAKDVPMAQAMLRTAAKQGAHTVVATPHFYWGQDTVESFLQDRREAVERLRPHVDGAMPRVRLGAEVLIREGISRVDLRPLSLEGTDILLAELPFMPPPGWLVEELENIAYTQRRTIMLAHLDRYMPWYAARHLEPLLELPDVIVQINAESLADRRYFRSLKRWLPEVERMVLGSDMHNVTNRAPLLQQAVRTLERSRAGREWLSIIENTEDELF